MLYERWREIAREFRNEIALRDLPSKRQWTFAELDAAADAASASGPVAFPRGTDAEFVIAVLRAWRNAQVTCPLESNQVEPPVPSPPRHIVHLKLTSATTGAAKLVAFTAEQLAADAANIVATMGLRRDWPNLAFISLAHSYGFSNLITPLLLHGIPLVLGGAPLPETVRLAGEQSSHVTLPAVPALWRTWNDAGAIPKSVRLAISAGAPLPLPLEREIFEKHSIKVHNFYGASECGGIAYDTSERPREEAACIGAPMKNVSLGLDSHGCLEVRGQSVGETYWPDTLPNLAFGVYTTADLAEIKDGLVYLRGRASDVINVAGRKISPEQIERVLSTHPSVVECLVFGVPSADTQRGDSIVACVVRRNGVTADDLRKFALSNLESWQAPREFWFVDSLQVSARGKLSRAQWREKFLKK